MKGIEYAVSNLGETLLALAVLLGIAFWIYMKNTGKSLTDIWRDLNDDGE